MAFLKRTVYTARLASPRKSSTISKTPVPSPRQRRKRIKRQHERRRVWRRPLNFPNPIYFLVDAAVHGGVPGNHAGRHPTIDNSHGGADVAHRRGNQVADFGQYRRRQAHRQLLLQRLQLAAWQDFRDFGERRQDLSKHWNLANKRQYRLRELEQ